MTNAGKSLRNAALVLASAVGRFGDLERPADGAPTEIRGTHKFKGKKGNVIEKEDGPAPQFTIRPLPKNYTFRDWHNYWRQFMRREFVFHKGAQFESDRPHVGKTITRYAKRRKVAAMKAAGHFKGDNRPFTQTV